MARYLDQVHNGGPEPYDVSDHCTCADALNRKETDNITDGCCSRVVRTPTNLHKEQRLVPSPENSINTSARHRRAARQTGPAFGAPFLEQAAAQRASPMAEEDTLALSLVSQRSPGTAVEAEPGALTRVLEVFQRHGVPVLAATVARHGEETAVTVTAAAATHRVLETIKAEIICAV
uniref:ACT domain-containing protein n=1 Tax=Oryza brachyantha TaxID=4533 RepID=J3L0I3_ORYBR